jgi:hypothetical protein
MAVLWAKQARVRVVVIVILSMLRNIATWIFSSMHPTQG